MKIKCKICGCIEYYISNYSDVLISAKCRNCNCHDGDSWKKEQVLSTNKKLFVCPGCEREGYHWHLSDDNKFICPECNYQFWLVTRNNPRIPISLIEGI